ncbi:MAG: hydrogenase/urease nickel incorporation protein HypA [Sulfurospirillaceae bacterium]|nr:hydrogenase/urease nickel incorporation protein HypA [Sulfurospirillaceae bacterium]
MHEYSIVSSLIEMCEEHAKKENATRITKVEVKIGKLSGVEPYLLESAFETFKEKSICDKAEFVMNIQDVVVYCHNCEREFVLEKNEFFCPDCRSLDIKTIDGTDMYLMKIEME